MGHSKQRIAIAIKAKGKNSLAKKFPILALANEAKRKYGLAKFWETAIEICIKAALQHLIAFHATVRSTWYMNHYTDTIHH